MEEWKFHAFLISALDGGEQSASCSSHFSMEITTSMYQDKMLGRSQSRSGHGGKEQRSLGLPEIEPQLSSLITIS
jgi:hypothetical protein